MKKNIYKFLFIGLALCWMGIIFYFSHQTGDSSSKMSGKITDHIIQCFVPNYENLSTIEQNKIFTNTSYIIRKLAHYSEYAVLGALLFLAVSRFTDRQSIQLGVSSVLGILYALSDEFHQSFVGGRSPMLKDVLIDSFGLLTMLFFICSIINFRKRKKKR